MDFGGVKFSTVPDQRYLPHLLDDVVVYGIERLSQERVVQEFVSALRPPNLLLVR